MGMFFLIPLSFVFFGYYKCPKTLNDAFLFQYEFKWTAIAYVVGLISYSFLVFFTELQYDRINVFFRTLNNIASLGLPSYLSTIWVPWKIKKNSSWQVGRGSVFNRNMFKFEKIEIGSRSPKSPSDEDAKYSIETTQNNESNTSREMREMLLNGKHFESFVLWMYREFSQECILSFIEFNQFQKNLINQSLR